MPIDQRFRYNPDAASHVQWGTLKEIGDGLRIIVNTDGGGFDADVPELITDEKYAIPKISNEKKLGDWQRVPMNWWQTQVNFAIWTATAGCGVGMDHIQHQDPFISALYSFHVYYQARRVLVELKAPLPTDPGFDPDDNPYDTRVYERLCSAFKVDPKGAWQFRVRGPNKGAGQNYYYARRVGYVPAYPRGEAQKFIPDHHSFTKPTGGHTLHIDYIRQDQLSSGEWTKLIPGPGETKGLTLEGVQRLNDSIRTYCWAILGAQGQTRSAILAVGTGLDAQKQFLSNVEDAINSPVDLPAAIARYQDTLQYAGSPVNFAFGGGLYLAPSDMVLPIERGIVGYNNNILTASDSIEGLGLVDVNSTVDPLTPPAMTSDDFSGFQTTPVGQPSPVSQPSQIVLTHSDHDDEKTTVIIVGTALFIAYYWRK